MSAPGRSDVQISPSLLAADFRRLGEEVHALEAAGADGLHLDLMDGRYVPNLSFGPPVIEAVRPCTQLPFDTHLMVEDPAVYFDALRPFCRQLTVHPGTCRHLHRTLQQIRALGLRAGVALNPADGPEILTYLGDLVDSVLIMTVNPGFGGQAFLPEVAPKIERVAEIAAGWDRPVEIAIDGGVNDANAADLVHRGATTLIAGSSIFRNPGGPAAAIAGLRAAASRSR